MANWETLSSRVAYENPFMRVHEDQTLSPTGHETIYGYCESTEGSAYVVPFDEEGNTYVIDIFRYPMQRNYWEVAAGRIPPNETLAVGAKRELLEETGLSAGSMTRVGQVLTAPGITRFTCDVFLAQDVHAVSDELDQNDGIRSCKKVSQDEFEAMVLNGEIQCAASIAAYYMCKAFVTRRKQV